MASTTSGTGDPDRTKSCSMLDTSDFSELVNICIGQYELRTIMHDWYIYKNSMPKTGLNMPGQGYKRTEQAESGHHSFTPILYYICGALTQVLVLILARLWSFQVRCQPCMGATQLDRQHALASSHAWIVEWEWESIADREYSYCQWWTEH